MNIGSNISDHDHNLGACIKFFSSSFTFMDQIDQTEIHRKYITFFFFLYVHNRVSKSVNSVRFDSQR